jgi:hypothetical protein
MRKLKRGALLAALAGSFVALGGCNIQKLLQDAAIEVFANQVAAAFPDIGGIIPGGE